MSDVHSHHETAARVLLERLERACEIPAMPIDRRLENTYQHGWNDCRARFLAALSSQPTYKPGDFLVYDGVTLLVASDENGGEYVSVVEWYNTPPKLRSLTRPATDEERAKARGEV